MENLLIGIRDKKLLGKHPLIEKVNDKLENNSQWKFQIQKLWEFYTNYDCGAYCILFLVKETQSKIYYQLFYNLN